jgi:hypothetical protein
VSSLGEALLLDSHKLKKFQDGEPAMLRKFFLEIPLGKKRAARLLRLPSPP